MFVFKDKRNVEVMTQLNKFQLVQLTNRIFYDFEYLGKAFKHLI